MAWYRSVEDQNHREINSCMAFVPSTLDLALPSLFKLAFSKLPNVEYTAHSLSVPGITLPEIRVPTPLLNYPTFGDKLNFDPFTINFLVQSDLSNYVEIQNWMTGLGKPQSTEQHRLYKATNTLVSDATLLILSNKYNPLQIIRFKDCFPTALGALSYDSQITTATPLTCDATFAYSYYTIEAVI